MIFRVKHNFATYAPTVWSRDYSRDFGPNNEGFELEAKDEKDAKSKLEQEHNLNPFYLLITKVRD